mmetsp:Transcript_58677/g.70608  ORF Transcript_58677/g.70608 Transcript_58677/m.70608 type:complete len:128 (-) Transcript_58677:629-1012(-)|eukprot:CAMPEP_0171324920 /NCGR_PEP_ID=MMETSP0816-20121228/116488_1 /TAXON_ID=420281 /ORGANISM="Proboscia inermis, Strain CCAP1064/1" /LENGTH=127 /DNA_ID=CAMNT_0011823973 /DNA_START=22 /DNA_END=405 /DNA_ORIENTATION=+
MKNSYNNTGTGSGADNVRGGESSGKGGAVSQKKESILELQKLINSSVRVKCLGGREMRGILRGFDELVNLVIDDCEEFLRDKNDLTQITDKSRKLGLVVVRGTQVTLVSPEEGTEEIANPFLGEADA